tara:strand:- start:409 stop:1032 length:624 start_codon:yes stop_codon:yes gene_type:complete
MTKNNSAIIHFAGYPIYKHCSKITLTKDELNFLLNIERGQHFKSNVQLSKDTNILEHNQLKRLKDIIWDSFSDYVDNVLEIENQFYICTSWSTVQKKGHYHPSHIHSNAVFSTILYAQADESSLNFYVDMSMIQKGFHFSYNIKNYNYFNSQHWNLPVTTGDIVTFPGDLRHESPIHNLDTDRIIIGASFFVKGEFGSDDKYNKIRI